MASGSFIRRLSLSRARFRGDFSRTCSSSRSAVERAPDGPGIFRVSIESRFKMQREQRGSAQASDGEERYNGGVSVSGNSYGYAQQQVRYEPSASSSWRE